MDADDVVGLTLAAGLVLFLIGAGGWRLAYERPLVEALVVIHGDCRRRAWIHLWMILAMFVTAAGVVGLAVMLTDRAAAVVAAMAGVVYALGALCWVVSLTFRLTVVPWAAERTVEDGVPPATFPPLDRWASSLYVVHMTSAYAAFAIVGAAALVSEALPPWSAWLGIGWGVAFLTGFVATRFQGWFNPPFWAHAYTGTLGVVLLLG